MNKLPDNSHFNCKIVCDTHADKIYIDIYTYKYVKYKYK